jgi:hypothetical protein
MSQSVVLPVDYQSIVSQVMDPDFHNKMPYWQICTHHTSPRGHYQKKLQAKRDLEDYGHLNYRKPTEEFDESRGYTACVFGWKMFCDVVGPFEKNDCCGNLYDGENSLGYIGYMRSINGKPYPIIHDWAMRTRLIHNYPRLGKFAIDKTDAIYEYESSHMN